MANNSPGQHLRPLQPAPMDQEQQQQTPQPQAQPQTRPLLTQKPKRTVTLGACVACRKRKSKCDGNRPICTCCTQKDTECVYELGPNEKPSQAMKRKNEEMQGELSNLRQVYEFLRVRPEQEALEILRHIRANPSDTAAPAQRIQELAELVRHGDNKQQPQPPPSQPSSSSYPTLPPDFNRSLTLPPLRLALDSPRNIDSSTNLPFPNFLPLGSEGPLAQRRRYASDDDVATRSDTQSPLPPRTSIEAIIDTPSSAVPSRSADSRLPSVKNWTEVTADLDLLVHLLTEWHACEYSYHHFFDWDIFLDDMANGHTDFCSKLLVHALLATACFHSPLVKDRSKPFADNIMTLFYNKARRLWELEEGKDSLPRLQAALCIFMTLGKHGRDKVGQTFLLEACRIARDIGLFRLQSSSPHATRPDDIPKDKWDKARAVTAWALYNFQLSMSFTYSFPPVIKNQPPVPIPYQDTPDSEGKGYRSLSWGAQLTAGTKARFRTECAKNIIILDCANTLMDPEEPDADIIPKPEQIEVLYNRLTSWWMSRPESLDPAKFPSPANLLTAMHYHVAITRLFQPFIGRESSSERIRTYRERARSVISDSVKEIYRLIDLHDRYVGWAKAVPFVLHPIMVASFGILEDISLEDSTSAELEKSEGYHGLLTCLRAISSIASYVFYAQPLFRLLTQACQALGIRLPDDVLNTYDRYQSEEWTKNAASLVSSQYIADIRKTTADVENARMDAIISQWDALSLDEQSRRSRSMS